MRALVGRMGDLLQCMRVRPLLQPYLDGRISDEDAVRVSRHLDACRRCGLAIRTFREMKAGLSRLSDEPDHDAVRRLEQFVDNLVDEA